MIVFCCRCSKCVITIHKPKWNRKIDTDLIIQIELSLSIFRCFLRFSILCSFIVCNVRTKIGCGLLLFGGQDIKHINWFACHNSEWLSFVLFFVFSLHKLGICSTSAKRSIEREFMARSKALQWVCCITQRITNLRYWATVAWQETCWWVVVRIRLQVLVELYGCFFLFDVVVFVYCGFYIYERKRKQWKKKKSKKFQPNHRVSYGYSRFLMNFFLLTVCKTGNMRPEFIAERRLALQNYINIVLMNPILASSLPAKKFVDPESYNQSFHDIAVQNASLCLRSDGTYALGKSLGLIGWRIRKHYFRVTSKVHTSGSSSQSSSSGSGSHTSKHILTKSSSQSHSKLLTTAASLSLESQPKCLDSVEFLTLAWSEYGSDKSIEEKEIHNILKMLMTIQHPFIMPMEYVASNDSGAAVIRNFYARGSLKDLLYGTSPKNLFMQKYGNPTARGRGPMQIKDIAIYGRQILEALQFLHSKGLPCGKWN